MMLAWMSVIWLASRKLGNAGIVDVAWALGLVMLVWLYALTGDGAMTRKILIVGMVSVWGIRLGLHLFFDRVLGKPEDPRYHKLRQGWKKNPHLKMFLFFQMQGALNVLLSVPFLVMCFDPFPSLGFPEWAALALWGIAMAGEAAADAQLKAFKANPANRGNVCETGLWNYSRHPNYFFEWLIWVAYFLAACLSPWGWLAFVSPALMLFFLLKVTGIPATEIQAVESRGDAYRRYQRTTSVFIPWFKRRDA